MHPLIRLASIIVGIKGLAAARAASGDLDTTFGPLLTGYSIRAFDLGGNNADTGQVLLTQSNGYIVLVGRATDGVSSGRIALTRLGPGGLVDSSFGSAGSASFSLVSGTYSAAIPYVNSAALDSLGRIIVVGDTANDDCSYVARFTNNGSIDASFGAGGVQVACPSSGHYIRFMDVAVDSTDRPVIGGTYAELSGDFVSSSMYLAARLTSAGVPDPTFNNGAMYAQSIGLTTSSKDRAGAIALDRSGRIYLGGGAETASNRDDLVILRLTPSGIADTTCGASGHADVGAVANSGFVATGLVFRDAHHLSLVGTWFDEADPSQSGIAYSEMDADTCAPGSTGLTIPATTAMAGRVVAASDGAVYVSYSQAQSNSPGSLWYAGILALFDPLPWSDAFTGINSGQSTYGTGIGLASGKPLQLMLDQVNGQDYDFAAARFQNDRIFYANFDRDGAKATP
ncbi:MAG: hypothetical protein ABIW82_13795 [Dokdonella sp.]